MYLSPISPKNLAPTNLWLIQPNSFSPYKICFFLKLLECERNKGSLLIHVYRKAGPIYLEHSYNPPTSPSKWPNSHSQTISTWTKPSNKTWFIWPSNKRNESTRMERRSPKINYHKGKKVPIKEFFFHFLLGGEMAIIMVFYIAISTMWTYKEIANIAMKCVVEWNCRYLKWHVENCKCDTCLNGFWKFS